MKAMGEALKRKMMQAKEAPEMKQDEVAGPAPDLDQEGQEMEHESNEAGVIDELSGGIDKLKGLEAKEKMIEGQEGPNEDIIEQILAALADRSSPGRGPLGLHEMAAQGAKEKLSQLKKK